MAEVLKQVPYRRFPRRMIEKASSLDFVSAAEKFNVVRDILKGNSSYSVDDYVHRTETEEFLGLHQAHDTALEIVLQRSRRRRWQRGVTAYVEFRLPGELAEAGKATDMAGFRVYGLQPDGPPAYIHESLVGRPVPPISHAAVLGHTGRHINDLREMRHASLGTVRSSVLLSDMINNSDMQSAARDLAR